VQFHVIHPFLCIRDFNKMIYLVYFAVSLGIVGLYRLIAYFSKTKGVSGGNLRLGGTDKAPD